ncbi:threonine synthase [Flavobacterium enshiense DK69]|uniref:Threonine synthase n=1 Tax=Flavobacterium enshiense DK69 TaxID=1107311 RepID=V6S7K8_9FLAO|nr:threonine synthase [Flavobacterium enshiense]ESU20385.1 threonine synthase [Flavobacterium enshiense DK69]KGO95808.1 threonine synthase [Flavobacterium enshiense DK69]
MLYYSLHNHEHKVSFKEAVLHGLAPDKGLYFPEKMTPLKDSFYNTIENYSNTEIAYECIKQFVGNAIPETELKQIIDETLSFDFPLIEIEKDIYSLELFHGPTLAFKDVGARFMSRCLSYFNHANAKTIVLVATSGDTGGAVASGFLGVKNTEVVILYPSGKVSEIQELQLTTLGKNITALEVAGTFDDCQEMVKKAFSDTELENLNLTSANSINIARWLPQMFYYFFAYKALKERQKQIVFSCPSGNFGNICAGVMAKRLGLPISHFVAATNANDTVPRFLKNGHYQPNKTIATLSNAMDVSDPSNFARIQELYKNNAENFFQDFTSYPFDDNKALETIKLIYENSQYITEPHGVTGYLGLKKELENKNEAVGIFLETAHPIKFSETVENALDLKLQVPNQLKDLFKKQKVSIKIENYTDFKKFLSL